MFESVHHITYLVWDSSSVETYFRKHFGLEPLKTDTTTAGRVSYRIGPTTLRFSEPTHTATMEYELIRRAGGPVISHIGLAVGSLDQRARSLRESGVEFTQPELTTSPHGGYRIIDIAQEGSCGMRVLNERFVLNNMTADSRLGLRLQLCEDLPAKEG